MSKARLVITAVVAEGRDAAEVAAAYGISKSWLYELLARYKAEGDAAFEPRSRRPKTTPNSTPAPTVELILKLRRQLSTAGLDAGPDTIRWHLERHHQVIVSRATVARHLVKAGLVTPAPKKRPKSSYIRFAATMPNQTWQSDFTHYRLADGTDVEILTWLDDCSRYGAPGHCPPPGHRPHRLGRVPGSDQNCRNPSLHLDRQRHGVHRPSRRHRTPRRTQQLRGRAPPPRHHPEERADPTTRPPAARSNDSSRRSRSGSAPNPTSHPPSTNCRRSWTPSSTSTTTADPTARCPTEPHQPALSTPCPKPHQATAETPTPTTGSVTTASTRPAAVTSASTADSTTSASAEPTPEPTSSCSSRTSTSASSTPPPANSSAN